MSNGKFLHILVLALTLSACSLFSSQEGGESGEGASAATGNAVYDNMLKEVTDGYNAASKEGAAWTNSEEYFEQAAEAAKAKDFDKAMKLLKEISDETALAKAQFEQAKSAGPHLF